MKNNTSQVAFAASTFITGAAIACFALSSGPASAASLDVDFQATIASEQHPIGAPAGGEGRFYNVSVNAANPGTGAYRATIPGTNNPAPPFVRNFDGPVRAYWFSGQANNTIMGFDRRGGEFGRFNFTTTDTDGFDRFGQQQGRLWEGNNPGNDLQVTLSDPVGGTTGSSGGFGGWRSLSDATGTIDVTGMTKGQLSIYYGAFSAKPTVSVVMRDTIGGTGAPDLTIANAHLNDDTADRTEYYLAEIDFETDGIYDEIEFVWNAGSGNGRGFAVVLNDTTPDAVAPTLDTADITDDSVGGEITPVQALTYTLTYSEFIDPDTVDASDFELLGTVGATIDSVVHYGKITTIRLNPTVPNVGTVQLQVKAGAVITDLAGNPLNTTSAITDPDIITVGDTVAPTVVSFDSPTVTGSIYGTPTITYTVAFSEFLDTVDASKFTNVGTAPSTIGTVTKISTDPDPSVYTVEVVPSGGGTVQLGLQGTIQDPLGNTLVLPVTDTKVFTLDTGPEPLRETVTLDGSATDNSTSSTRTVVFNASGSDKLVVIVTGENGNPGSLAGKVNSLTYDGEPLIQAVGRLPIGSAPSASFDQTYNDIWYLDNPGAFHSAGNIVANVNSRGVITVIGLSGTAPGVGATAISAQEIKSVSIFSSTTGGMVIASLGMGGDGNTANVGSVNTIPAAAELSAVLQGSSWNGHVTSRTPVASAGLVTSTFIGGNTTGTHVVAAEFLGREVNVLAIDRSGGAGPNTNATTPVSWDVTFDGSVTALDASYFSLAGSLAGSSTITGVTGSGSDWVVTASNPGGCGTLGLNFIDPLFEGEVYGIDTVAPVISCAKQIVVTVPEGQSATVNYAPTAFDECDGVFTPVEVVCDPPSPGTFAVGNHVVECTATDSAGNEATASFNVVVLVQQPVNSDRFLDGVSVRGDDAEGTGVAPGATILAINNAFLNDNGDVVFDASLQGNGANNSAVFFRPDGGSPAPVAAKGASFGAGAYGIFSNLSLNDAGDIGFQSLTSGNLPGHFAGPGAGPVANSARRLGASPSGGVYNGLYQPALASNGELLTPAALLLGNGGVTSLNDSVITSSAGTVVAREGSPSGIGAINHGQFLARVVASDADGRYAFPSLISESPPTGGNAGIFVGQLGGSPTLAVRKGDAAAGTPGTFSSFLGESVNSDGEIALRALVFGAGVNASNNEGIWTNSGNTSAPPVLVAREGDVTPCIAGGLVAFSSFKTVYMGDDGSVCFLAYLKDSDAAPFAMVNASNDASIWLWRNGALDLIVREGDLANSTDGAVVGRIVDFDSNGDAAGGNGIAYSVEFAPISGDTTSRTNQAVYVDRGGEDLAPVLVLRRGDKFTVGEDEVDVLSLRISSAQAYTPSGSTGGFGRAINGDGDVLLNVGFTGSKSGIFVLGSPPEDL